MSNRHMDIARQLQRALIPPNGVGVSGPWQWGTVASISATTSTVGVYLDSNAGTAVAGIPYVDSYVPTVGDAVVVGRGMGPSKTSRIVLGRANPYHNVSYVNGAAPTTGTYRAGTVLPDLTYPGISWLCTSGGSPGTWVAIGSGAYAFAAYDGAGQSIPNNGWSMVAFDSPYDPHNLTGNSHGGAGANSTYACPFTGLLTVESQVALSTGAPGDFLISIYLNGAQIGNPRNGTRGGWSDNNNQVQAFVSNTFSVTAGDYIQIYVYQHSGGAVNTSQYYCWYTARFVGQP